MMKRIFALLLCAATLLASLSFVGCDMSSNNKKKEKPSVEENDSPAEAAQAKQNPPTDLHLTLERDLLGMTFVQEDQVVHQRFVPCGENPAYQFGEISMMLEYFRSLEVGRGSEIRGVLNGTLSRNARLIQEMADILVQLLQHLNLIQKL